MSWWRSLEKNELAEIPTEKNEVALIHREGNELAEIPTKENELAEIHTEEMSWRRSLARKCKGLTLADSGFYPLLMT